jgi:hypothetical protein
VFFTASQEPGIRFLDARLGARHAVSVVASGSDNETAEGGGEPEWELASKDLPQTRQDWDTILEEYRKIVRSEGGTLGPQG